MQCNTNHKYWGGIDTGLRLGGNIGSLQSNSFSAAWSVKIERHANYKHPTLCTSKKPKTNKNPTGGMLMFFGTDAKIWYQNLFVTPWTQEVCIIWELQIRMLFKYCRLGWGRFTTKSWFIQQIVFIASSPDKVRGLRPGEKENFSSRIVRIENQECSKSICSADVVLLTPLNQVEPKTAPSLFIIKPTDQEVFM